MNTICAAVMEGTRGVGNVSVLGPRCFATEKATERWRDATEVLGERVTFCVKAEGLRKVGQHKTEHVSRV